MLAVIHLSLEMLWQLLMGHSEMTSNGIEREIILASTTKKTYRELRGELDEVLAELQSAKLDIDKALELYKKGQVLIAQLEDYLKTAKNEIEK